MTCDAIMASHTESRSLKANIMITSNKQSVQWYILYYVADRQQSMLLICNNQIKFDIHLKDAWYFALVTK